MKKTIFRIMLVVHRILGMTPIRISPLQRSAHRLWQLYIVRRKQSSLNFKSADRKGSRIPRLLSAPDSAVRKDFLPFLFQ